MDNAQINEELGEFFGGVNCLKALQVEYFASVVYQNALCAEINVKGRRRHYNKMGMMNHC